MKAITEEKRAKARELYTEGRTKVDIAKELHISRPTLDKILEGLNKPNETKVTRKAMRDVVPFIPTYDHIDAWMQQLINRGTSGYRGLETELGECKRELSTVRKRNEELEIALGKLRTARDSRAAFELAVQRGEIEPILVTEAKSGNDNNVTESIPGVAGGTDAAYGVPGKAKLEFDGTATYIVRSTELQACGDAEVNIIKALHIIDLVNTEHRAICIN